MKPRPVILVLVAAFIAILLSILSIRSSSAAPAAPLNFIDRATDKYNGIRVTLVADRAPTPGETVELTLTVEALIAIPRLETTWTVPTGATLLGDPTEAFGPLAAGDSATSIRHVQFPSAGVYQVIAGAGYSPATGASFGTSGVLFFTVSPRSPHVSDLDPTVGAAMIAPAPATSVVTPGALGRSADDDPCFHVFGYVERMEMTPTAAGLSAPTMVRVRNALVELREEDIVFDDSYGEVVTNSNGEFSFSFCDDDGWFDDELELYLRITAELYVDGQLVAEVEDNFLGAIERNYRFDTEPVSSEGGEIALLISLNKFQSSIFNMADAALDAYLTWRNFGRSPSFREEAEIQYQPNSGVSISHYNSFWGEIYIADDPSDPDPWDDSVIIHEWGHMADDLYSCDDNPGGGHSLGQLVDPELAWGEGYPNFWQSAVRASMGRPDAHLYIDTGAAGEYRGVNLETYARPGGGRTGDEMSVAAALWDLFDSPKLADDDKVAHPLSMLQQTYVGDNFKDVAYGFFDDNCDIVSYLKGWLLDGRPQDGDTAAAIGQNLNVSLGLLQLILNEMGGRSSTAGDKIPAGPARWWDEMTFVVDRSSSMAGTKMTAVKKIIGDQVSGGAARPNGTAFTMYTFDAAGLAGSPLIDNRFYAADILPIVNNLPATGANSGCPVQGLGALAQAIPSHYDGDIWLYTDGDSADKLKPETLRQTLNAQRLRASILLLGGCGSPLRTGPSITGIERTYLGNAADGSQPAGIVPYMMTALLSGGQFIYVAPNQLADAADVARAQMNHTAGAGRWSDYVSTDFTYRWDRLKSWEYQWYAANGLGTDKGMPGTNGWVVALDKPFPFFGSNTSRVRVDPKGYILMNYCDGSGGGPPFCIFWTDDYARPLAGDLKWYVDYSPKSAPDSPQATTMCGIPYVTWSSLVRVFYANYGSDWIILSTEGVADYGSGPTACRRYQVWLNTKTGEIRFLYGALKQEAATAEIGLALVGRAPFAPSLEILVSKNSASGASNGMGYKFTPAPPQPTKAYEVEVDSLIDSVVFMQTGYSGDFAPMVVTRPDGSPVGCAEGPHVSCVTMHNKPGDNMVQYIQVDTLGASGVFTATVAVGPSGNGTFSFNALAASPLHARLLGDFTLASTLPQNFVVDLGRTTSNGQLQGWLQTPAGLPFGPPFALYDDGTHGDGVAGDGLFVSTSFKAPAPGAAYLWVKGASDGVTFQRSDPAPLNFQPLSIVATPSLTEGFYGKWVNVVFTAKNEDTVRHCYNVDYDLPEGWQNGSISRPAQVCMNAGGVQTFNVTVRRLPSSDTFSEQGRLSVTLTETEAGSITAIGAATIVLHRPITSIRFENVPNENHPLRPNGTDTAEFTLNIYDDLGLPVAINKPFDGTISAQGGTVQLLSNQYEKGYIRVRFTAGAQPGQAKISAVAEGGLEATATITLAQAVASDITLAASATDLSAANGADLTITVLDSSGEPAAGAKVRISVNDDKGARGKIDGIVEGVERTTNQSGVVTARFDKVNGASGSVIVQAELINKNGQVVDYATVELFLAPPPTEFRLYLPITQR